VKKEQSSSPLQAPGLSNGVKGVVSLLRISANAFSDFGKDFSRGRLEEKRESNRNLITQFEKQSGALEYPRGTRSRQSFQFSQNSLFF
jgi:hypothetical protein